jgi:hypothetical protein
VWHVKTPDQVWELDGRTVFSDISAIALDQARRLLPNVVPGEEGELVEICDVVRGN